jgi:Zn-dependent protease with chaperone function
MFSPFLIIFFSLLNFQIFSLDQQSIDSSLKLSIFISLFFISFLMLCYLFLDFLFGFSIKSSLKNCQRYEKIKDYDFLSEIFEQVKTSFDSANVKLYIKNSDEINAYAAASFNKKIIVLTHGIIKHYLIECDDPKKFLNAIRSVMAHEMSHLINKDFLPTFLIIANQKATNLLAGILDFLFRNLSRLLFLIPKLRFLIIHLNKIYHLSRLILTSFNRFIVFNIYEFLRKFINRSIEYRCDKQAALAFGGHNMALALSMLGENGYFTLFSTHPNTQRRINKIYKIKAKDSEISANFFDSIANYFAIMFLMVICLYFAKEAGVDIWVRRYIENHQIIHEKIKNIYQIIRNFI